MSAVLLGREVQNTPEWDALRSNGIGGSEIAAIVGLSPWVSRYALWHRKRGLLGEQRETSGMNWGKRLEAAILDAYSERFPEREVKRDGGTYRHSERTWQIANLDASSDGIPLDAKTAHQYDSHEWGPDGTDEVPPYYRAQLVHYGDVFDKRRGEIAVLIGGSDFRCYSLSWSEDEAEWLREEGAKFWAELVSGIVPSIDEHSATYEAIRTMHPDIEKAIECNLTREVWDAYSFTKADAKEATDAHRQAKAVLLDQMGQAQFAMVDGETVLRRQPGRGGSVSLQPIPQAKRSVA